MNYIAEALKVVKPPPILKVSEWADEYRVLSPESSAEPGRWHTSRAEYQRGIMDAINDPDVERVIAMTSAQIGKTEILINVCGYFISQDPAPILVIQPNLDMAQAWSKDRFAPLIRDCDILKGMVKDPKTKDSNNTILHKSFPGGHITISGANSPAGLASRPIRVVLCDEIDKYPPSAGAEGDPVELALKRSTTFWNRINLLISTPTVTGLSRIEKEWDKSDQRRFFVPCPKCKYMQYLRWANVTWMKDDNNKSLPHTAKYKCEKCGKLWDDAKRWAQIRKGEWRKTAKSTGENYVAGFHLNEIYSPWVRLGPMASRFINSKDNPELLKTFVNTSLGETWEESGETVDETGLYSRREKYKAQVPKGGLVLVAAVDVQDDRLEGEVIAYGKGEESWGIEYFVIHGDPGTRVVWNDLARKLDSTFKHEDKIPLGILCTCIDSGGHFTDQVYKFCKGKEHRRIYAIKGANTPGKPIISRPLKSNKARIKLFTVGTDTAKQLIYSRLRMKDPGPGYVHFPLRYDQEYFAQLTAEKATTKYTRGFPHRVWVKKPGARNEALDIRVYSLAALAILNPNFEKIAESFKRKRNEKSEKDESTVKKPSRSKRRKSWATGWIN
jgi:phage terminase large subunit GpA-like protein